MMALFLLQVGALVSELLAPLEWLKVTTLLVILIVARPVAGLIGLWGHKASRGEKATIAFFGIRRVGSVDNLA